MADVTPMKTPAEQALSAAYEAARATLPGKGALADLRADAFQRFEARGLPHRRVEEWKYTDLRALMREAYPLAPLPDAAAKARAKDAGKILAGVDCRRLVFVDGAFVPELSDLDAGAGADHRLARRRARQYRQVAMRWSPAMSARPSPPRTSAVALNTAFMGDGAVIHVADGAAMQAADPSRLRRRAATSRARFSCARWW